MLVLETLQTGGRLQFTRLDELVGEGRSADSIGVRIISPKVEYELTELGSSLEAARRAFTVRAMQASDKPS